MYTVLGVEKDTSENVSGLFVVSYLFDGEERQHKVRSEDGIYWICVGIEVFLGKDYDPSNDPPGRLELGPWSLTTSDPELAKLLKAKGWTLSEDGLQESPFARFEKTEPCPVIELVPEIRTGC